MFKIKKDREPSPVIRFNNEYLYFLFYISGADDEYERFNGYHAYSIIKGEGVAL